IGRASAARRLHGRRQRRHQPVLQRHWQRRSDRSFRSHAARRRHGYRISRAVLMLDTIEGQAGASGDGAAPAIVRQRLKGIAVLGSHPATKRQAPYNDDGWLIYACSPDNSPYGLSPDACAPPRVNEWFEVHNPVFDRTRPYEYLDWLRNIPVVWMRDPIAMRFCAEDGTPLFPTARLYPEK